MKTGSAACRYGFNGKENDNEIKGEGTQQDYGMRIYSPPLGRFLSVDPIAKEYPELTTYQFASNSPIFGIDRDGLELFGNNWLFDIWLEWKFGDPTGAKKLLNGSVQKSMVESRQMSYHNDKVPQKVQNKLDHINTIDANAKVAAGTAQVTTFVIKTSAEVSSNIVPIGEGLEFGIQGVKQLNRFRFATKIYKEAGTPANRIGSHLEYLDFEKKLFKETFEEGKEFIQYRLKGSKGFGDYYAPKGTTPSEIGLDPNDIGETYKVTLKKPIEGFVSSHKRNKPLYYDPSRKSTGGGTQIYSTEIKKDGNATFTKIQ